MGFNNLPIPEKDPNKIAAIYKKQLPTKLEQSATLEKLERVRRKLDAARKLNRGIKK